MNQGGFLSVLHFEVLKLMLFLFDQSFKSARVVSRDRQSLYLQLATSFLKFEMPPSFADLSARHIC